MFFIPNVGAVWYNVNFEIIVIIAHKVHDAFVSSSLSHELYIP